jgi:thiol-disulfide isomerase/thioredoxin
MGGCYRGGLAVRHAGVTECGDDGGMKPTPRRSLLAALAILVAACSSTGTLSADPVPATPDAVPTASADSPIAPLPTDVPGVSPSTGAETPAPSGPVLDQAWATATLTDVTTGESFRIADLAGQTIIVETMAIWCPSCFGQQSRIDDAIDQLGPGRVTYVVIDVDPSETAPALAQYREQHGFDGRYVVADRDVARALAAEFGDQVLNPPSTPVVFIGTDGRVTLTPFGPKSADDIVAIAEEHGA